MCWSCKALSAVFLLVKVPLCSVSTDDTRSTFASAQEVLCSSVTRSRISSSCEFNCLEILEVQSSSNCFSCCPSVVLEHSACLVKWSAVSLKLICGLLNCSFCSVTAVISSLPTAEIRILSLLTRALSKSVVIVPQSIELISLTILAFRSGIILTLLLLEDGTGCSGKVYD